MKPTTTSHSYDAIVIGSGMGGLTTASLLAQFAGKRVLVLERHFKLGGFTHSFRRKKYEWDVGVHYVGDMAPGSMTRGVMDLVTGGGVEWHKMQSPYERFIFPEASFDVPDGAKAFQQSLIERFPSERANIRNYFRDVFRAQSWLIRWFMSKQYSPFFANALTGLGRPLVRQTTAEYMARIQDPLLRAILTAQWPDFGTPPHQSAFGFHATVTADFFKGGYYPVGGAKEIANCAVKIIEDAGGQCLVNHEATSIIVRDGKAVGVRVLHKNEEIEFHAPIVISNAGAMTTFGKLVSQEHCDAEREQLQRLKPGMSANVLFLGLNDDPRKHGFDDCNYWIYSRLDHDIDARQVDGESDRIDGGFLSFGSIRNPGQEPHTAQIICYSDESQWHDHDGTRWMRRGQEYENKKEQIAQSMIDYVEARVPGLRKLIDYHELSTPLTVKSFTGHWQGTIYGQRCDANRIFEDQWRIGTSLKNLYLTGSDVGTPGVNGAMMAGVMTAGKLMGMLGVPRIMWAAMSGGKTN